MKGEHVATSTGFATGGFGPLAVSIWEGVPTPAKAQSAASLLATMAKTEPNLLVLAVLGPSASPPDGEVREILTRQLTESGDRVRAVVNVIEGRGFRAATVRAVLTGMALALRAQRPDLVCDSVEEGGRVLASLSDGRLTPSDVSQAVTELRDLMR
jgi:hypothetical protein